MTRQWRIELIEGIYHILSRGNQKQVVFKDDEDKELFIQILGEASKCRLKNTQVFPMQVIPINVNESRCLGTLSAKCPVFLVPYKLFFAFFLAENNLLRYLSSLLGLGFLLIVYAKLFLYDP